MELPGIEVTSEPGFSLVFGTPHELQFWRKRRILREETEVLSCLIGFESLQNACPPLTLTGVFLNLKGDRYVFLFKGDGHGQALWSRRKGRFDGQSREPCA